MQWLPLLATRAGAGVCAYLAFVMYEKIGHVCLFCSATHVITVLLFLLTLLLWPRRPREARSGPGAGPYWLPTYPSTRQFIATVLFAVAISVAGCNEYHSRIDRGILEETRAESRQALVKGMDLVREVDQLKATLDLKETMLTALKEQQGAAAEAFEVEFARLEALAAQGESEAAEYIAKWKEYESDYAAVYYNYI